MASSLGRLSEVDTYAEVRCPHCQGITYVVWASQDEDWKFFHCRCGKVTPRLVLTELRIAHYWPIEEPSDLQKRQAVRMRVTVPEE